jgi:carboxymethylenebutenolidase
MLKTVKLTSSTGIESSGELALPAHLGSGASKPGTDGRVPSLIVVHEWWGINDDIRGICDRFAQAGFAALAVDLYAGRSTTDIAEAMQLVTDMKTADAMTIIAGAVDYLSSLPRAGKIGITGFCLGGGISIAAACNVEDIVAAVPFYGTPRDEFADFSKTKTRLLGHYGKDDPMIRAERVRELMERAKASGVEFDVHFYDAGHAFMRPGESHHAASAELAWQRTIEFFGATLA